MKIAMSKHHNKRKAIQAALGQSGWQASGKDVVALLADLGIAVSEGLVGKVKVAGLKQTEEIRRQRANAQEGANEYRLVRVNANKTVLDF